MLPAFLCATAILFGGMPTGGVLTTPQEEGLLAIYRDESRDPEARMIALGRLASQRALTPEEYASVAAGMDAPYPAWWAGERVLAEAGAAGLGPLRGALAAPSLQARQAALLGLSENQAREPEDEALLIQALTDEELVEFATIAVLKASLLGEPLARWVEGSWDSAHASTRQAAVLLSGYARPLAASTLPRLAAAVKGTSLEETYMAFLALQHLREAGAPILADVLEQAAHPEPNLRLEALLAALAIAPADPQVLAALEHGLTDPSGYTRQGVAAVLATLDTPPSTDAREVVLSILASDEEAPRKYAAALCHYWIDDPTVVDGLVKALHDSSASVRENAALSLAEAPAVPRRVLRTLYDGSKSGGREAEAMAVALALHNPKARGVEEQVIEAMDPTIHFLGGKYGSRNRRHVAPRNFLERLSTIASKEVLGDPPFTQWRDQRLRRFAIRAFGNLEHHSREGLEVLRRIRDEDPSEVLRQEARSVLRRIEEEQ